MTLIELGLMSGVGAGIGTYVGSGPKGKKLEYAGIGALAAPTLYGGFRASKNISKSFSRFTKPIK